MAWLAWRGAYVRGLGLKSKKGWEVWRKNGRPSDIPSEPSIVYRDDGWISWSDWLGFKGRAPPGGMLPFAVGRAYARKLKLRRTREWKAWSKSGRRPFNIPSNPDTTYRDDGWISWPDWIGYGSAGGAAASRSSSSSSSATTAPKKKSTKTCRRRPTTTHPGHASWPYCLGSGSGGKATNKVAPLPFAAARAYARKLKLKSQKEWREWGTSGQRPSNIPAHPERMYRDDGWISMPDWLGYGSEGGAAASRSSSSSRTATTAPKNKSVKKRKRKRRRTTTHPSDLPPPPPPSTSSFKPYIKTEPPSSKSGGGSSDRSTEPPLRKIKKEEDA